MYGNRRYDVYKINVKETRRDNQEWTIQRHWNHCVPDTERGHTYKKNRTIENKKDEQLTIKPEMNPGAREGWAIPVSYKTPVVLFI
jgi:hypothetical protein